ncbi:sigma-70 family RNA polymerase sigma factor [Corynebacterium caspium]|uniref:sigma-70 family RNA polymerase sigma factor n=1 Tax=Corynebacterium caspium TaxID=234828 RepID=UPI00036EB2D5|nr:sigma-70 family RNA polymerase sigma factor [Corynebacterium caspium]WKD58598.1 ECF RNA polymerase sigma factor SigK [Corynebacterium caspium DSM 44850]
MNALKDEVSALLIAVGRQDQEAFSHLYDRVAGYLLAYIRKVVLNEQVAEDILQITMWQIWEQASTFDPERGSAQAWLAVLARRRAIDYVRTNEARKQREAYTSVGEPESTGDSVPVDFLAREAQEEIATAVQKLSPAIRESIDAVFFRSMTHQQAAEYLGIPLGTLKTRVRSGITQLRHALEER